MELIEILKKLKSIEADSDYVRKSRMIILRHSAEKSPSFSMPMEEVIRGVFHSGWSIALTAALIILTISSFSISKILSPATTAVVDLTSLRAEAQAIDIQIRLTNVAYNSPLGLENKTSTQSIAVPEEESIKENINQIENEAKKIGLDSSDDTTETAINSALKALSE